MILEDFCFDRNILRVYTERLYPENVLKTTVSGVQIYLRPLQILLK